MKSDQKISVSAIVCAYNEEKTITAVVETLINADCVDEVIVVNDGSTDDTKYRLDKIGYQKKVSCIHLNKNRGKGYAMTEGVNCASGELLLFVDADLLDLQTNHLEALLYPILDEQVGMVIGTPIRGKKITQLERMDPCRPLSGQRVLRKSDFEPLLKVIRYSGYGVETILNLYFREQKKAIKTIFLPNLNHPIKVEKTGFKNAAAGYILEGIHIVKTIAKNPALVMGALTAGISKSRME